VHVIQFPNLVLPDGAVLIGPETMTNILSEVGRLLEKTGRELSAAGGVDVTTFAMEGSPFVEILRRAESDGSDLIVLGTHGRSALGRVLLGSVAERVVRKAACAVLTVRGLETAK
jgi:nucleotide-binding universal stress UspA family protein